MRVLGNESVRGLAAYFGSLVHQSVRGEALTAARHQSFIASLLLAGLLALCVFPVYLVVNGRPSLLGAAAFLWLLSPIGIAIFVSRTGKFAAAHLASAANFAGLVTYCAWLTGGLSSWLIPWMVAVPLEAALATDRRIVAWSAGVAGLGLVRALRARLYGHLAPVETLPFPPLMLALLGAMTATAYAAGLAVMVQLVHKQLGGRGSRRRGALPAARREHDRHDHSPRREGPRGIRLACARKPCSASRCRRSSATDCSSACTSPTGPAYLTALSRSLANNEAIAVEFRVRRAERYIALCVGRDALPADAARRERRSRARRHRRDHPRHLRSQGAGGRAVPDPRRGREREPRQDAVPRQYEPRASHAAERGDRLL